tara:strand:- start:130 stop:687 length:558 start_codon:yes stop_codon:yes gene_type:complete
MRLVKYFKGLLSNGIHPFAAEAVAKDDDHLVNIKTVLKVDKQIKGHKGFVTTTGNTFEIVNNYWMSHVRQSYNIDEKMTYTSYQITQNVPKYLSSILKGKGDHTYQIKFNDDYTLFLSEWNIHIEYNEKDNGLLFHNHYENINRIKEISQFFPKLKQLIKNNPNILDKHIECKNSGTRKINNLCI